MQQISIRNGNGPKSVMCINRPKLQLEPPKVFRGQRNSFINLVRVDTISDRRRSFPSSLPSYSTRHSSRPFICRGSLIAQRLQRVVSLQNEIVHIYIYKGGLPWIRNNHEPHALVQNPQPVHKPPYLVALI